MRTHEQAASDRGPVRRRPPDHHIGRPSAAPRLLERGKNGGSSRTGRSLRTGHTRRRGVATTQLGHVIRIDKGLVEAWDYFREATVGRMAFTSRDTTDCYKSTVTCNGDSWGYPGVLQWVRTRTDAGVFTINDISNMNGGYFPIHTSHQDGVDVDAHFAGYEAQSRASASALIAFLRANAANIESILSTLTPEMRTRIEEETERLSDGRLVGAVILFAKGHTTHFHIRLKSKNPQ